MAKKKIFFAFLFLLIFSSCSMLEEELGLPMAVKDIPTGEYKGTAKLLDGKDWTPGESQTNTEIKAENGTPQSIPASSQNGIPIKITFMPKEEGFTDAVGVLVFNNSSQRFLWRNDGNNKDYWNVLFVKDNNLYSNLQQSFKFTGLVKQSEGLNFLEGRLNIYGQNEEKEEEYYVEAKQTFDPKLEVPKEKPVIKGGENLVLTAELVGDKIDSVEAFLLANDEQKTLTPLPIENMERDKKGKTLLTSTIPKGFAKGKYFVYVVRDKEYKSNYLNIEIQ